MKNREAFLALVRGGLWEREVRLSQYGKVDFDEVMRIAEEQSIIGLVTAGLEHVSDVKVPQEDLLQFVGQTLQIEQQNKDMNVFLARLIERLRREDVYAILVKGQGIAQCYERPLWRTSGDIDLYLNENNYQAAKECLTSLAEQVDKEDEKRLHFSMTIDSWVVELHGTLHSYFPQKVNKGLDDVHKRIFYGSEVRSWNNDSVTVFLPSADNDVIIVFTHILQHFFVEGIGLRQICDWCRLLWTYRGLLNHSLLESRIQKMGLMSKWKAFAAFAVDFLGMSEDAMPFYDSGKCWHKKGERIIYLILDTGTFGHNRDMSYKEKDIFIIRLVKSFKRRTKDGYHQFLIFPLDALRMWGKMFVLGMSVAMRGVRRE